MPESLQSFTHTTRVNASGGLDIHLFAFNVISVTKLLKSSSAPKNLKSSSTIYTAHLIHSVFELFGEEELGCWSEVMSFR